MLNVRKGRIDVFKPGNSSDEPDFTVPAEDIQLVDASIRAGQVKDEGKIVLSNDEGEYTIDDEINSGDRLHFWLTLDTYIVSWGTETWGDGAWGGELDRWSAMVRDREMEYLGPNTSDLTLSCEDFALSIASKRRVYNTFRGIDASGHSDAVVETMLDNNAEEIGQSRITPISNDVWITFDGDTLLDALTEVSRRANAVMRGRKGDLIFKPLDGITREFELQGTEIGRLKTKEVDSGMVNRVRIDGGEATALETSQENQSSYTAVTESTRATFQINTRKAELAFIELWTNPTGSEEAVTVRIQKDDGGAPIAPGDESSDIVSATLDHHFLANDDFTTFLLGSHTLPEPNPWVIVETDGSNGQDIGTDSNGNETYKAHYGFNLTVRNTNRTSRNQYRLREGRIKDDAIQSPEEAHDIAEDKLNHDSVPEHTVEAPADNDRTHHLSPLDMVYLNFKREQAVGDYLVTERNDQYDGSVLDTTLTLQEVGTI